jgi:hypothetical protein
MGVMKVVALFSRCVGNRGVFTRMVLNLGMRKIVLFWPTRSDQYNMGPGEVSFTAMATSSMGIENRMNANSETNKSKILFCILLFKKTKTRSKTNLRFYPTISQFIFLLPFTSYLSPKKIFYLLLNHLILFFTYYLLHITSYLTLPITSYLLPNFTYYLKKPFTYYFIPFT